MPKHNSIPIFSSDKLELKVTFLTSRWLDLYNKGHHVIGLNIPSCTSFSSPVFQNSVKSSTRTALTAGTDTDLLPGTFCLLANKKCCHLPFLLTRAVAFTEMFSPWLCQFGVVTLRRVKMLQSVQTYWVLSVLLFFMDSSHPVCVHSSVGLAKYLIKDLK